MTTLETLIKLQKSYVDEQRQHLAKLQEILDMIERHIAELEIEKAREQIVAEQHPESRTTYGVFLKAMGVKGRNLENERKTAVQAIEQARAKLSELFEEQKRYEIAEEARIAAAAKEEARRERIAMDEIGGMSFERKKEK